MFRFAHPEYLYLLLLIPALMAFYIFTIILKRRAMGRFGIRSLLKELMPDVSYKKQNSKYLLLLGAITALIFVIAGPQFGSKLETVKRQGVEIMVCLDVSNSMLSEDVSPSRLDKAKQILSKLIDRLQDDKIGLIVFAGQAYTQLPITADQLSAKMFLSSVNPSLISVQGTSIGEAIDLAARSFSPDQTADKAIILITDAENHEDDALGAAKRAAEKGIKVDVVGVGDPSGAPIPVGNSYLTDKDGNMVITKLNESLGQEIAAEGKGIYVRADNTNNALKALIDQIDQLTKSDMESKVYSEYNEQFQSIAWIVFILLLIEFFILDRKNRILKRVKLFS
ncbi:MAG: VWA domain-containing protein [Bacteroidales bacterium]|nr:VWA domain-containing protein [Bacteroidales bacterium]